MSRELAGETALVTGASKGSGFDDQPKLRRWDEFFNNRPSAPCPKWDDGMLETDDALDPVFPHPVARQGTQSHTMDSQARVLNP